MTMIAFKKICLALAAIIPTAILLAAEPNNGLLGSSSRGHISLSFEVNENIVAGFLQSNLEKPRSEFRSFLTTHLVQRLQEDTAVSLPFCVISNGGGYYEIAPLESREGDVGEIHDDSGATLPFYVVLGDSEESVARYKAASNSCDASSAIQVTIRFRQSSDMDEISNLNGKINLLVKSE